MEKKDKILAAALKLFAQNGVDGTSTSKVAKAAGVSEGLIFRHYKNKQGLLDAILEQGYERGKQFFGIAFSKESSKEKLKTLISLPFMIKGEEDRSFWRLMYALKWQADVYNDTMSAPIKGALVEIFKDLGYKKPKVEAETLMLILDGIATTVLLKYPKNEEEILNAVLEKYELLNV